MARASDHNFLLALLRDRTFQARETRRVLVFTAIYVLFTTLLLAFFYHQMLSSMVAGVSPLMFVSEDMGAIDEDMPQLAELLGRWLFVMMVVNIGVTLIAGVYILRKLGEPILALRRVVTELGRGNFAVGVRDGRDESFKEVFEELRATTRSLDEALQAIKTPLSGELEDMDEQALRDAAARSKQALEYFRLSTS